MKFHSTIKHFKAAKWGIDLKLAYVFSWIYDLPSKEHSVIIENEHYYFASRYNAILELPLSTDKPDTMWRYYKKLETAGLIVLKNIDNKDYIKITAKGKTW